MKIKQYFPNLNGLRFIAVMLVLVYHIEQVKKWFGINNLYEKPYIHQIGSIGVKLFFVLSGFLIAYLLLKEHSETSTISIRNFYKRRILRIHPLYYLMIILGFFVFSQKQSLLLYVFMMPNLVVNPAMQIGHLWSIGVEEQFYLFFAPLVKFFKKYLVLAVASIILFVLGMRALLYFIAGGSLLLKFFKTFEIECILTGVMLAYWYINKSNVLKILYKKEIQIISLCVLILSGLFGIYVPLFNGIYYSAFLGILILNMATNNQSIFSLENKVFDFMGRISYGMYMFHLILIIAIINLFKHSLAIYTTSIISTILIAAVSYYLIEKPFLNLKDAWTHTSTDKSNAASTP